MNGFVESHRATAFLLFALLSLLISACNTGSDDPTASTTESRPLSNNAELASIELSSGGLDQLFQANQTDYTSEQGFLVASLRVIPTAADPEATITVAGTSVASGEASAPLPLTAGDEIPIAIEVTSSDGTVTVSYSVAVTRQAVNEFAQQAYVKASNAGSSDAFGASVALSGNTLAVGAPGEDGAAIGIVPGSPDGGQAGDALSSSGAVYVFVRDDSGNWSQQAYIKGSNVRARDLFGSSVSLTGDMLAVGAPGDNSSGSGISPLIPGEPPGVTPDSGAVYVFVRDGEGNWSEQAYIKASNATANDRFGDSVALDGNTLAVGASLEDGTSTRVSFGDPTGAVYVFVRDTEGAWSEQAYIKASNAAIVYLFGDTVALDGDTLAVGAFQEDGGLTGVIPGSPTEGETGNGAPVSGAVYVFVRDASGVWSQQAYIKASNTGEADNFGWSVALEGDTLAVGAVYEDSALTGVIPGSPSDGETGNAAEDRGAVYVFVRDSLGAWIQQAYIKASGTEVAENFGRSVAIAGDTLAVLAGLGSATVYIFSRSAEGAWSQQADIKDLGGNLALDGDTLAMGEPNEDSALTGVIPGSPTGGETGNGAPGSGAVYIFR